MLTLERIQMLQSGEFNELESTRLLNLDEDDSYFSCNNTFFVDDFDSFVNEFSNLLIASEYIEDEEEVTGLVLKLTEGDIDELWFTLSSIPYDLKCEYYRLF
jgi:hypothetical protein